LSSAKREAYIISMFTLFNTLLEGTCNWKLEMGTALWCVNRPPPLGYIPCNMRIETDSHIFIDLIFVYSSDLGSRIVL